jgi:hypothetical protein
MVDSSIVLDLRRCISIYFYSACIVFDNTGQTIEPKISDCMQSTPSHTCSCHCTLINIIVLPMVHKCSSMALFNQGHFDISMLSYWANIGPMPNQEGRSVPIFAIQERRAAEFLDMWRRISLLYFTVAVRWVRQDRVSKTSFTKFQMNHADMSTLILSQSLQSRSFC